MDFVHLHVHTEYSLLDGANRIKQLMARVSELGMKSIAITDHGAMYGVVDFYKEAVKCGIKPILGCEVYVAPRSRLEKQAGVDAGQAHLILLARNMTGYKNLIKLVSAGFTEGFYYKPRIDMELLGEHAEGITALSACLSGDIPKAILQGDYEKAKKTALRLNSMFGQGYFYLELQNNGLEEQNLVNQNLIKISKETGIPLVATNDAHYLRREDAKAHEILLCIQTGKRITDEDRMKFSSDDFYIKSPDEMQQLFKNFPEAMANTLKIAESCNLELEFNKLHLPEFKVPEQTDPYDYLRELCHNGLKNRFAVIHTGEAEGITKTDYFNRLEYELNVIRQMKYVEYFLIVWDFIRYAKENKIMVGPGRGSAAGSLTAYCLGITNIDPVRYNLLFERFLNPERISMPDIDIDFCYERRQEVIDYVVDKYGKDRVAQIITFGTMAARAAIRDVGRAMDIPYNDVDAISKMIPNQIGMTIDKALEINHDLVSRYQTDERITELINTAKLLEGMPRHASTHAAGVVISKEPITEYVPLQKNDDIITTQFTMGQLEELGLLKMDFLGLRTLTVIRDAIKMAEENNNIVIDLDTLDMDDPEVFKLISEGRTSGVFQLESGGMTQFMKELMPTSLEDIIAGISLYRPGPMEQIPRYIRNKNNPSGVRYEHPLLENILDVTYGCMVYQEQVMQIVRELGGYSMGRADLVRRAMSKKKHDVMQKERDSFINGIKDENGTLVVDGALRRGVDERAANKIFDEMMDFASYAFNKSHAAAYAVIAYQTAFLKRYWPVEFMAASLNSFMGSSDKISQYVAECKALGIEILPPDINESREGFSIKNGKIRFGLAAVKNVGVGAVESLLREREQNGLFKSFADFTDRIDCRDINKRCIESLIKCGAFDQLGVCRSKLSVSYERMIDSNQLNKKRNVEGQLSLFGICEGFETISHEENVYPDICEFDKRTLLAMEKEMLGLYVSGHPLTEYQSEIDRRVTIFSSDLAGGKDELSEDETGLEDILSERLTEGMRVTVAGCITERKMLTTKSGSQMVFLTLEDLHGTMKIIVFPKVYNKCSELTAVDNIVFIRGKLSLKEDEQAEVICEELSLLKNDVGVRVAPVKPDSAAGRLHIRISGSESEETKAEFYLLLKKHRGDMPVYTYLGNKPTQLEKNLWITPDDALIKELESRFGKTNVKLYVKGDIA